jgi:hypothetical protein
MTRGRSAAQINLFCMPELIAAKLAMTAPQAGTCAGMRRVKLLSLMNDLYDPPLPAGTVRGCHRLAAAAARFMWYPGITRNHGTAPPDPLTSPVW